MITYEKAVNTLATKRLQHYLAGGQPWGYDGASTVASVYEVPHSKVCDDIEKAYRRKLDSFYESNKGKS